MKQVLFIMILLLLHTREIHAQELVCGTFTSGYAHSFQSAHEEPVIAPNAPYTQIDIALAMHIVRDGLGNGGFDPASLPQLVTNLNSALSSVSIRFFITSTDFINDQTYYDDFSWTNEEEDALSLLNKVDDAINVYFLPNCQYAGKATLPPPIFVGREEQSIILKNANVLTSTSPHEMGHYFNLLHTFDEGIYGADCPDYSNCSTLGDRVCDTPAEPDDPADHPRNFNSSCQYTSPDATPPYSAPYRTHELTNINGHNYMTFAPASCRTGFTTGQVQRMRTALETLRPELSHYWIRPTNIVGGTNAGGTFSINGSLTVNSGSYAGFENTTTREVRTNNERFSPNKHHDWNGDANAYMLGKTFEPSVSYQSADQNANFNALNSAIVTTSLVDATSLSGGTLQFNDPWYLNWNGTQGNNFGPQINVPLSQNNGMSGAYNQTVGGVFLNQDYNIPGNPYYSVGAPNPNIFALGGQNYQGCFLNWEGTSVQYQNANAAQTPVVFTNSGATATAKYKAHLASSSSVATGSGSQRKMCKVANTHYLVYESSGKIWVTTSTNGTVWGGEYYLADGDAPSVSGNPEPDVYGFVAVYRRLAGGAYRIYFKEQTATTLGDEILVSQSDVSSSIDTRPVVCFTHTWQSVGQEWFQRPCALVVWQGNDGLRFSLGVLSLANTWGFEPEQPVTNAGLHQPSLSNPVVDGDTAHVFLTSENAGHIWMKEYIPGTGFLSGVDWVTTWLYQYNRGASVAVDETGRIHVSWVGHLVENDMDAVFQRSRMMGETVWSPTYQFADDWVDYPILTASVSAHNDGNGGVSVFWTDGSIGGVIDSYSYDGYTFDGWSLGWTGAVPNSPSALPYVAPASLKVATTLTVSPLYRVSINAFSNQGYGASDMATLEGGSSILQRTLAVCNPSDSSRLWIRFGDIRLLGARDTLDSQVKFPAARKDFRTTFMRSVALTNPAAKRIHLKLDAAGDPLKHAYTVGLHLVDSLSGAVVGELFSQRVPVGRKLTLNKIVSATLPAIRAGHPVYIAASIEGLPSAEYREEYINVVRIQRPPAQQGVMAAAMKKGETKPELPTEFALHENYPNPFNPSTQINFDLPEAANVSLVIYDVLGRKVAELVNGQVEAGYRSVTWNAASIASGVYFARFTATNPTGEVKLTKVNKLLLTK